MSGCEYTVLKAACSRRYSHDGKRAFAKTWNLVVQHMTLGFLVDGVLIRHNYGIVAHSGVAGRGLGNTR